MWGQYSLPHFDEASAAGGPQSVAGHTSLTTVKNFQFTKLAGQKNNEAEPHHARLARTDSGTKGIRQEMEQRHRN